MKNVGRNDFEARKGSLPVNEPPEKRVDCRGHLHLADLVIKCALIVVVGMGNGAVAEKEHHQNVSLFVWLEF